MTRDPLLGSATIHELVSRHARSTPDATAVVAGDEQLTYQELDAWSDRLSGLLAEVGVTVESKVAIAVPRSLEFVVAALAVLKAGGAYIPIDPGYPRERREFMLADSAAQLLITSGGDGSPADVGLPTVNLDRSRNYRVDVDRPLASVSGDNLAYVIYTSGSTGTPKGVEICHAGVVGLIQDDERLAVAPGDVVAHLAPTAFDASVFEIWAALGNGGQVVVLTDASGSISELGAQLRACRPDWLFLTAGLFHLLVENDAAALASVGTALAGGDVVSPRHVRTAARHVRRGAHAAYGPTETTVFVTLHTVDPAVELGRVPLGNALRGRTVHVLDDDLRPVPDGEIGEIYLGGGGLARGYHGRPSLTAERFVPDPFSSTGGARLYRTGDRGRVLPDGEVEFHGRVDRQVKIRGFRVEPGEVEAVLSAHEAISAAAVAVAPDPDGVGKRLVGYLSVVGSADLSVTELREWLAARLPEYLLPANFLVLDELPLDPNGKIDRRALPAPWRGRDDLGHLELPPYVPPATDTEWTIAEVFLDVLGLDKVGTDDNFFQLGGDSLRVVRLIAGLEVRGISVKAREFFANPTIHKLATIAREPQMSS